MRPAGGRAAFGLDADRECDALQLGDIKPDLH